MKLISLSLFTLLYFLLPATIYAQDTTATTFVTTTNTTASFKVHGLCVHCERRIEKAALIKGVQTAAWDAATQMLTVTYDPAVVSLDQLHKRISAAGHDTELKKAKDDVYNALPECCHYREGGEGVATDTTYTTKQPDNTLIGLVLEEDGTGSNRPLERASIKWLGTASGTITNAHGAFVLPKNGTARHLVISYAGLKTDTVQVGDLTNVEIFLSSNKNLSEVRVVARKPATFISAYNPFRTATITQKELLKAACCNLSETFETNPSVDVSYNDAVTGSKQIQLLGLSGNYSQLTVENLPGPRGLATAQGLNSISGTWVESIQLTKGIGSVVNGFESIAGQINVELKKPQSSERLYANVYTNEMGKTDVNLNVAQKLGKKWSTAVLLHDAFLTNKNVDFNKDGYRDLPTGNLFSGMNRWHYESGNGLMTQFGVKVLLDSKTGGETGFEPSEHKFSTQRYGLGMETERYEAFAKVGYVFGEKWKSIGLQLSAFDHTQDSYFGLTTYDAAQKNMYANLIYQSIIGNTAHLFKTGASFVLDQYNENFNTVNYKRREAVPGGFFEYNYHPSEKLDIVAGLRADHNSLFGWFATPRLNVRYQPVNGTTLRLSAGRGQRTANLFAENNGALVSSRTIEILGAQSGKAYGLDPEVAWNKGISLDQKFKVFGKGASLGIDFFRNDFQNQVVVDVEDPRKLQFYNLEGKSFSNSFQAEVNVTPVNNLDLRLAYRFFDVKTTFKDQLLQKPFTARHRAFANLAYDINNWKLDYTINVNGSKRIPGTESNPAAYHLAQSSPAYVLMNAQVSKTFGKDKTFDVYIGGENLTNYLQQTTILAADQPFGPYFDASMIWGPVSGRMLYGGVRYTLK